VNYLIYILLLFYYEMSVILCLYKVRLMNVDVFDCMQAVVLCFFICDILIKSTLMMSYLFV
jgi:hypothetical protein